MLFAVPVVLASAGCEGRIASSPTSDSSLHDASIDGPRSPDGTGDAADGSLCADGSMEAARDGGDSTSRDASPGDRCPNLDDPLLAGEHRFTLDGRERRYIVHLPGAYSSDRVWPVVFALHANNNDLSYWTRRSERDPREVMGEHAIVVFVEAIGNSWRDYDEPSSTWPARIALELEYLDAVVARLESELCVRRGQMFALGFSGGGSFAGLWGCQRSYLRAIAVGGAVIYFDRAACASAPSAWITIGEGELNSGREAFRDIFRDASECDSSYRATLPESCVSYENCAPESAVHYCPHAGGHEWPTFGTQAAWDFFTQFLD